jgi:hypothetical protein
MLEFWVGNPLIEMIFGIVSILGAALLGWSNLIVEPPKVTVVMPAELDVWERHQLRLSKNEGISR